MRHRHTTFVLIALFGLACMLTGGCLHAWFGEVNWRDAFATFWGNR